MDRTEEVLGGMSGGDQVISKALNEAGPQEREPMKWQFGRSLAI